jgi:hypothetical protein
MHIVAVVLEGLKPGHRGGAKQGQFGVVVKLAASASAEMG